MARISHPTNGTEDGDRFCGSSPASQPSQSEVGEIEVEIVDKATHNGLFVQVQAVEDEITLSDQSGNAPWVEASDVEGVEA